MGAVSAEEPTPGRKHPGRGSYGGCFLHTLSTFILEERDFATVLSLIEGIGDNEALPVSCGSETLSLIGCLKSTACTESGHHTLRASLDT